MLEHPGIEPEYGVQKIRIDQLGQHKWFRPNHGFHQVPVAIGATDSRSEHPRNLGELSVRVLERVLVVGVSFEGDMCAGNVVLERRVNVAKNTV